MVSFLRKVAPGVEQSLQQNETVDIFQVRFDVNQTGWLATRTRQHASGDYRAQPCHRDTVRLLSHGCILSPAAHFKITTFTQQNLDTMIRSMYTRRSTSGRSKVPRVYGEHVFGAYWIGCLTAEGGVRFGQAVAFGTPSARRRLLLALCACAYMPPPM